MWGLVFSSFDCTLAYARQRDDPWNAIGSGFLTGGVLAARAGLRASAQSALVGGVLLALIEGLSITINKLATEQFKPVRPEIPAAPAPTATQLPPMKLPSLSSGSASRKKESEFLPGTRVPLTVSRHRAALLTGRPRAWGARLGMATGLQTTLTSKPTNCKALSFSKACARAPRPL